ncbi:MAG: hypothetical protein ACOYBL_04945 [Lachnospiraceae bacterium]
MPALSDRIGRTRCIRWVLILAAVLMVTFLFPRPVLTMTAVIWLYGYYGGIMGLFPSYTSSIFGLRYAGENYAYVLLGMILAALGALLLSDMVFSGGGTQEILFVLGMIFSVIALICVLFLDRRRKKAVK